MAMSNLPAMDRSSDTIDAFDVTKLCNTTYKTEVCRKPLNPVWDSEWYRYEVCMFQIKIILQIDKIFFILS